MNDETGILIADANVPDTTYHVLGVPISSRSKSEFYERLQSRLENNDTSSAPYFIVTVNPEIIVQSIVDHEFRQILASSTINTADGVGISWAVKKLYGVRIDRITGSDSLEQICRLCAQSGNSVFFYGAMPGVADQASKILKERIDSLIVEGTFAPEQSAIPLEQLPVHIQHQMQSTSVMFIALGAPAQEKWIHQNLHKLRNCKAIIGVGGSFDFITGNVKRAPVWLCRSGLEWLYRLIQQPSRWRRMIRLPIFFINIVLLKASMPPTQRLQKV